MKTKIKYFLPILPVLFFLNCKEENLLQPYGADDGVPPGVVTLNNYTEIPGGIELTYNLPTDEDVMYIKATYKLDTGKEMETRTSVYSHSMIIEGFGNVEEKTISLSAVDRHENEGEVTSFKVIPGRPSYMKAYETIKTSDTFGGIAIDMDNEDKGNLIVDVITTDSIGDWYSVHTEYTSNSNIHFAVRGFDTTPREFKITVKDVWENTTDPIIANVVPLFEKELDREKFRKVILENDESVEEWDFKMEQLWNGKNGWSDYNMIHTVTFDGFPRWFTFDLGVIAKLSRYKYWQRLGEEYLYQHGNLKTWEIWGREDTPSIDGSWDGWTKLLECESIKPSGRPLGLISAEDIEYATKGEEFEFPDDVPPVRYIRVKALSTFSGSNSFHIQQMWFWGQDVE